MIVEGLKITLQQLKIIKKKCRELGKILIAKIKKRFVIKKKIKKLINKILKFKMVFIYLSN